MNEIYTRMLDACADLYTETETFVTALSAASLPAEETVRCLAGLEQTGAAFRREATGFLTSDAVSGFDEDAVYDAKRHVHTDLGRVLTLTGTYLPKPDATSAPEAAAAKDLAPLLSEWREVLQSLKTGTWRKETADAKKQLTDAAKAAGVRLCFSGALPEEEAALRAFIREAATKILAAARAGEDTVTI